MQKWAKFRRILFVPSEVQSANKRCSVCQQERQRLQMAVGKIPGEKALNMAAGRTGRLQVRLGKSEHALWPGFAYPAPSAVEKQEPKTLHQSGLPSHLSSDQGTCSLAHNVQ